MKNEKNEMMSSRRGITMVEPTELGTGKECKNSRDLISTDTSIITDTGVGKGRGRKKCPKCFNFIGVRSRACNSCNYIFSAKEEKEETRVVINGKGFRSVYTPSQYQLGGVASFCPVKLHGTTFEQVSEWAEKVLVAGEKEQLIYTPPALKYFIRHSFEMYSKEWKEAVVALNELASINSEKELD